MLKTALITPKAVNVPREISPLETAPQKALAKPAVIPSSVKKTAKTKVISEPEGPDIILHIKCA